MSFQQNPKYELVYKLKWILVKFCTTYIVVQSLFGQAVHSQSLNYYWFKMKKKSTQHIYDYKKG